MTPDELTLRPFSDDDIALMERWLRADHVRAWYEHPDDWLMEIHGRRGEFRFITHMIAEIHGFPIGFCQYYDCWHSKEYEAWDIALPGEAKIFSIDYLVGETEYLRCGYGKAMITHMLAALRRLGAESVIVQPDTKNIASNRVLEACGFRRDGELYMFRLQQE